MHYVALGAGQADVFQTRSSSLRTRGKDVVTRAVLTIDSNVVLPAMPYPATIEIPPDTTGEFRSRDALGFCLCRHTFTGTSRNAEPFAAAMTGVVSHISHVIQTVSVHVPAGSPPSPARRHRRARASAPSRRSPRPGPHRGSRSIQRKMYG